VRLRVVPGSACGTLERGWPRPKVLARANQATDQPDAAPGGAATTPSAHSNDEPLQAIEAVLRELANTAPLRGAQLHVELADSLMHLDVVAGDFAGDSDRKLQSIAVACVDELLGEATQQHEIRWQLQRGGQHLLIGAIARDFIQSLSEVAARHGLTLCSVQPDFCLQWNRYAGVLKAGSAVFAVASGLEAVVAQVHNGAVAAISHGAWLDRHVSGGLVNANAQRLMCGFGLEPSATASALDARVDRLLACAGLDAKDQHAYLLVAPQVSDRTVSPRWTVLNREVPAP